jgi:predicted XRE-type DNA-binding protein
MSKELKIKGYRAILLKGKIDKFSLDALVNMLGHAGMRVRLLVKKAA